MLMFDTGKQALQKTAWSVMWLAILMLIGYIFAHNEHHHKHGHSDHTWKDDLFEMSNHTEEFLRFVLGTIIIAGSVLLAPSIIIGYAVKAAERDDLENGR